MAEHFAALVLWMLIEKWTLLFGLLASIGAYFALRPRQRNGWSELGAEGWRLLAIAAAGPAFLLGAELSLWSGLIPYRAPLAFTGLPEWLGLFLVSAALIPPVAAWVYGRSLGRGAVLGLAVAMAGIGIIAVGRGARAAAWHDRSASVARGDIAGLDEVALLKVHRYISRDEAFAVFDRVLPSAAEALGMAERARANAEPAADGAVEPQVEQDAETDAVGLYFDQDMREYFADRIESALEAVDPTISAEAVPTMWRLTRDVPRTLRAYALARPPLRALAIAGQVRARDVLRDAMLVADAEVELTILNASYQPLVRESLGAPLVDALAAHQFEPEPVGRLSTLILLREASTESLRPVAPRFSDPDAPEWSYLLQECPAQMIGMDRLSTDPDPAVAEGARALRRYVEQNCVSWVQQG